MCRNWECGWGEGCKDIEPPEDCISAIPNGKWVYDYEWRRWRARQFPQDICALPARSGPLDCDTFYNTWSYDNRYVCSVLCNNVCLIKCR